MSAGTDISALYCEFTDALTEVLAENAGNWHVVANARAISERPCFPSVSFED
jgi:hypothetical protein